MFVSAIHLCPDIPKTFPGINDPIFDRYGTVIKIKETVYPEPLAWICKKFKIRSITFKKGLFKQGIEVLVEVLENLSNIKGHKLVIDGIDQSIFGTKVKFYSSWYYEGMNTEKLVEVKTKSMEVISPETFPEVKHVILKGTYTNPLKMLFIEKLVIQGNVEGFDSSLYPVLTCLEMSLGTFTVSTDFELPETLKEFSCNMNMDQESSENLRHALIFSNLRKMIVNGIREIRSNESTTLMCGYDKHYERNKKRNRSLVDTIKNQIKFGKKRETMSNVNLSKSRTIGLTKANIKNVIKYVVCNHSS